MSIPSEINLPLNPETLNGTVEQAEIYLRELTVALEDMYEMLAFNVNGIIKSNRDTSVSTEDNSEEWTPVLAGTTTAGSFTYDHQIGWVIRQGLFTDVWFDVQWTALGGATGNLYLELPYQVAVSEEKPFVGICQPSGFTFTGGTDVVVNGIPDTFRAEFWNVGTGFTTANQSVVTSGQVIGHLRYIGQENEE